MRRRPWGFWATSLWGVAIIVSWYAAQLGIVFALLVWFHPARDIDIAAIKQLLIRGDSIAAAAFGTLPLSAAIIALAIWRSGLPFRDYLALRRPRAADVGVGIATVIIALGLADLVTHLSGRSVVAPAVFETYRVARDSGTLPFLAAALVIAAPLGEELIFRGFLFRGWAASRIGAPGAVVLSAAVWASMHLQYDWFFMSQIFVLGVLLGWLRWRSGSLWLTMLLHAGINGAALLQAILVYAPA